VEGHRREAKFADVDLSRTVCWFTSPYPLRLDVGPADLSDALTGGPALGRAVKSIKEQLRAVADNGLGYGLLRYLNAQTASELAGLARPQIGFNYLGRFPAAGSGDWTAADEPLTLASGDAAMALAHCIEVNALTLDGSDGATLTAHWSWSAALFSQAEVRDLAQGWFGVLEALVRHADRPGAGGRSPCDLPLLALSQAEIERIESKHPQLQEILPLAPLQEGLLFHALYDVQGSDVYTVQLALVLEGRLDEGRLRASLDALLKRHESLRASFEHANLSRPVQLIRSGLRVPWRSFDLSGLEDAARAQRVSAIVAQDRAQRFDLDSPPLLRFTLMRMRDSEHRLILTCHHILLDGWSGPILVRELLTLYAHAGDAGVLPPVRPYRDYLSWLAGQDRAAAVSAWRELLGDLQEPTHISAGITKAASCAPQQLMLAADEQLTKALSEQTRRHGLTLNTVMQTAWAIVLGRLVGRDDVVFGVTLAGRPPEIAGVERMVGLFINTLPLRVKLPAAKPLLEVLKQVQDTQSGVLAFQYLSLAEIQSAIGLGELFDTLVVFENYPVEVAGGSMTAGEVRLTSVSGHDATHYPLGLMALPGEQLRLRLDYRPDLFERSSVERIGERLIRVLRAAVSAPDVGLSRIDILSPEERRLILRDWNATSHVIPSATLPALFAGQVERRPDAVAVVVEGSCVSYGELERGANQLGH